MADLGHLSEVEKALIEDDELDPLTQSYMVRAYRIGLLRTEVYKMPMPTLTPDEIRRNRAAAPRKKWLLD
jgi:hypothetical protein